MRVIVMEAREDIDNIELITLYFNLGIQYAEIVDILSLNHNINISMRHLKRILRAAGLNRRNNYNDLETVYTFIEEQLNTFGGTHGYRWMYHKCLSEGIKVRKEDVRILLRVIDAQGVELRRMRRLKRREYFSKGPNFCWHIDSYDKLKPFGLCINGCIDGYSRKMIWLRVGRTSSDSKVIAKYFIDSVEEEGGCPKFVRGDMETENATVAAMQTFLRRVGNEDANNKAFIYGRSTMNTRIESWWGILRRQCCHIWIEELKMLRDDGSFTGNELDTNLVQFSYMRLLQEELDSTVRIWNTHRIRKSRNGSVAGRPLALYLLPELEDAQDHLCNVTYQELDVCRMECAQDNMFPCDENLYELCCILMAENNKEVPRCLKEATQLYLWLRELINMLL